MEAVRRESERVKPAKGGAAPGSWGRRPAAAFVLLTGDLRSRDFFFSGREKWFCFIYLKDFMIICPFKEDHLPLLILNPLTFSAKFFKCVKNGC